MDEERDGMKLPHPGKLKEQTFYFLTQTNKSTVAKMFSYASSSSSSSSLLGATALREPWPPVLFVSIGLYPELSFSILQSPSLVGPLERHLAI
jgi:hypothetical protein